MKEERLMDTAEKEQSHKNLHILWRGVCGLCPHCGKGKIFKTYITPNAACAVCHEDLSGIRADDAPPWLTILITGHIIAPVILYFAKHEFLPEALEMTIIMVTALLSVLLILPRSKGLFIAAIWLTRQKQAADE
jgi:uncharacterized protein (DUF983 family)